MVRYTGPPACRPYCGSRQHRQGEWDSDRSSIDACEAANAVACFRERPALKPAGRLLADGDALVGTSCQAAVRLRTVSMSAGAVTTLHSFAFDDGSCPASFEARMERLRDDCSGGSLFYGTLFRITPTGLFTLLHSFMALYRSQATGSFPRNWRLALMGIYMARHRALLSAPVMSSEPRSRAALPFFTSSASWTACTRLGISCWRTTATSAVPHLENGT